MTTRFSIRPREVVSRRFLVLPWSSCRARGSRGGAAAAVGAGSWTGSAEGGAEQLLESAEISANTPLKPSRSVTPIMASERKESDFVYFVENLELENGAFYSGEAIKEINKSGQILIP